MSLETNNGTICVHGVFKVDAGSKLPSLNDYERTHKPLFVNLCHQIGRNATFGTFGDYTKEIFRSDDDFANFSVGTDAISKCIPTSRDADIERGEYTFELYLSAQLFCDTRLGFQKLVHTLVSDVFEERGAADLRGRIEITKVDLEAIVEPYKKVYRSKSHSISDIRAQFRLGEDEPLLAFSIKPRVGLNADQYRYFAQEVFRGGFHLVEMDTRDLNLETPDRTNLFCELCAIAIQESKDDRVCRFSVNLSSPFYIVEPILSDLWKAHGTAGTSTWVVKVDGNLDGISTIQAIRLWCVEKNVPQPIITCYPVLKYGLQRYLGADTLFHLLVLSGADIIYPGGRPRFYADNAIDGNQISQARRHYSAMRYPEGYPLPSVATGTLIGHVPATLAVLGTDIAFFVGGGLALSRQGLKAAASAFSESVQKGRRLRHQGTWSRSAIIREFRDLSRVYAKKGEVIEPQYEFVDPCEIFGQVDHFEGISPRIVE